MPSSYIPWYNAMWQLTLGFVLQRNADDEPEIADVQHRKKAKRKWEQDSDDDKEEDARRKAEEEREKDQQEKDEFAERLRLKDEEKTP